MIKLLDKLYGTKVPNTPYKDFDFDNINLLDPNGNQVSINDFIGYKMLNIIPTIDDKNYTTQTKYLTYEIEQDELLSPKPSLLTISLDVPSILNSDDYKNIILLSDINSNLNHRLEEMLQHEITMNYIIILSEDNKLLYFNDKNDYIEAVKVLKKICSQ